MPGESRDQAAKVTPGTTAPGMPGDAPRAERRIRGRTLAERREERRDAMLAAGLDLFGTKGYAATTVEEVCRRAYVSSRNFYEEFDNRLSLLVAVGERIVAAAFASWTAIGGPGDAAGRHAAPAGRLAGPHAGRRPPGHPGGVHRDPGHRPRPRGPAPRDARRLPGLAPGLHAGPPRRPRRLAPAPAQPGGRPVRRRPGADHRLGAAAAGRPPAASTTSSTTSSSWGRSSSSCARRPPPRGRPGPGRRRPVRDRAVPSTPRPGREPPPEPGCGPARRR